MTVRVIRNKKSNTYYMPDGKFSDNIEDAEIFCTTVCAEVWLDSIRDTLEVIDIDDESLKGIINK